MSGQYRVVPSLAAANSHINHATFALPDIALVTQCSSHHLREVPQLASRWQGPISVAVFSEIHNLGNTLWEISRLRFCHSAVKQNVSFQLVSPLGAAIHRSPILPPDADTSCEYLDGSSGRNYAHSTVPYPVNLLRNVARRAAQTEFVFVMDVDMLPSAKLRERFLSFASKAKLFKDSQRADKTVYVVPAFEAKFGSHLPEDKKQLLQLSSEGSLRPFYFELCWKCQVNCVVTLSIYNCLLNFNCSVFRCTLITRLGKKSLGVFISRQFLKFFGRTLGSRFIFRGIRPLSTKRDSSNMASTESARY